MEESFFHYYKNWEGNKISFLLNNRKNIGKKCHCNTQFHLWYSIDFPKIPLKRKSNIIRETPIKLNLTIWPLDSHFVFLWNLMYFILKYLFFIGHNKGIIRGDLGVFVNSQSTLCLTFLLLRSVVERVTIRHYFSMAQ